MIDTDAPAVRLLNDCLRQAAQAGASDLHFEAEEVGWRVRFRIDGYLQEIARPPAHLREPLISRIKVLSRIDIAERRIPQDGRLRIALGGAEQHDYRVSTLPTVFGEKVVLRKLDTLPDDLSLDMLGCTAAQQEAMRRAILAPQGMLLVTGPTGSGKTLTLFCLLQLLDRNRRNVCTVEDPAELRLAGVNQVNVHDKAGLTFAAALRALLRQDPDVIMIGEIRDRETADVALRAAQTGHLVLSTLHTNDAPSSVIRLLDIGVEPFNVAAAVRLVTAQRLLRRLCLKCRQPLDPNVSSHPAFTKTQGANMGADASLAHPSATLPMAIEWRAIGCEACRGTGYRGRLGVHQVMPISAALRDLIAGRAAGAEIARQARRESMRTLRQAAVEKALQGLTTLEEAHAATESDE